MPGPILELTRHAQAEHNVADDYSIPDAPLTALGREQAKELNKQTENTVQKDCDLLVCSPLRRTMQTMLLGYPALRERLGPSKVILNPIFQEVNALPCDTGSDVEELKKDPEFTGLDFSTVEKEWTSKQGIYDPENVQERARQARRWLRSQSAQKIAVVAHGDILRNISEGYNSHNPWNNAEVREFTFKSMDDEDAVLVPLKVPEAKAGGLERTSSEF